jgi:hypothetical protein
VENLQSSWNGLFRIRTLSPRRTAENALAIGFKLRNFCNRFHIRLKPDSSGGGKMNGTPRLSIYRLSFGYDKGEQGDRPRPFDGHGQFPLVLGAVSRNPPWHDLAPFRCEISERL